MGGGLTTPCPSAALLPDKDLSTAEVARLWGRDRRSLAICASRHKGLAAALRTIQQEQGQ